MLPHPDPTPPSSRLKAEISRPSLADLTRLLICVDTYSPDGVEALGWLIREAISEHAEHAFQQLEQHRAQKVYATRQRLGSRMPAIRQAADETVLRLSCALEEMNRLARES